MLQIFLWNGENGGLSLFNESEGVARELAEIYLGEGSIVFFYAYIEPFEVL